MSTSNEYTLGRKARVFATKESTCGVAVDHAGTDVISHKGSFQFTYGRGEEQVDERKGSAGVKEFIRQGPHTVSWAYPDSYLKPSGTAATYPEQELLFEALMGSKLPSHGSDVTVQASPSPTTTSAAVSSVANIAVGQCLRFAGDQTSGLDGESVFVTDVTTSVLTWIPALSEAPTTNDTIEIGEAYPLTDPNAITLSLFQETQHTIEGASGCFINDATFTFSRNGTSNFSCGGEGVGRYSVGQYTTVNNDPLTSGATTLNVPTGDGKKFLLDSNIPLYLLIESEVVKVTAVSGDALTIARAQKSTSAAQHAQTTEVEIWSPTLTRVGNPVAGLNGFFRVAGAAYGVHTVTITAANGKVTRENELGSTVSTGNSRDGNNPRVWTVTFDGKFKRDDLVEWGKALAETTMALHLDVGPSDRRRYVFYVPKLRLDIPPIPPGDTGEAMLSLTGTCLETSGNDEIYFGIV